MKAFKALPKTKRDAIIGAIIAVAIFGYSFFASTPVLDFMSRMVIMMLFASALNIILGFGGLSECGMHEVGKAIFGAHRHFHADLPGH